MQHPGSGGTVSARRLRLGPGLRILVAALAAAACASCSSGPASVSTAATSPTLLVHDVRGSKSTAGITGYLRHLSDADCFVLESDLGADVLARQVAVWPPGTRVWRSDGQVAGVDVPGAGRIPVDGRVVGGGGYANATNGFARNLPDVSPECLSSGGEFVLIHEIAEAT
ncbi:hypothetical protein [Polymorphospora rubra]|uniref:hypothetical protein n=1 Tax=Polymorphospora rubra TaxID=338584 RepID=UPI001BB4270C|nr:hypothetical protein [Polymorphospora rubra]